MPSKRIAVIKKSFSKSDQKLEEGFMNHSSKDFTFVFLAIFSLFSLTAISFTQETKKKLTYQQVYKMAKPRIFKRLLPIRSWLDDEHYLVTESDPKTKHTKLFKVNAETGKKRGVS